MALLIFHVILSFFVFIFVYYVCFFAYLVCKTDDSSDHSWYNLKNTITYLLTYKKRGILHEKNITS